MTEKMTDQQKLRVARERARDPVIPLGARQHAKRYVEDVAHAAGRDAGNRSMRAAGRTAWNDDDYNAAATERERVLNGGRLE